MTNQGAGMTKGEWSWRCRKEAVAVEWLSRKHHELRQERGGVRVEMITIAPTKASAPTRRRFTVDEYYAMAKAGILTEQDRVELLDGDIIAMPPIGHWHADNVDIFTNWLPQALHGRAIVRVQGPLRLSDVSEPEPDVMLLRSREGNYRSGHPRPSDVLLVIEVADTSVEYDKGAKLSAYARAGIAEVWIVVRKERRVEVYTGPGEGGYANVRRVGAEGKIAPGAFPDVELEVGKVVGE